MMLKARVAAGVATGLIQVWNHEDPKRMRLAYEAELIAEDIVRRIEEREHGE